MLSRNDLICFSFYGGIKTRVANEEPDLSGPGRMLMLKAVIFDFDGTLADTGHILYKVYDRFAKKHNLPPIPHDELDEIRSLSIRDRFKKAGVPLFKLPGMAREALRVYTEFIGSAEPFPGIEELIHNLKAQGLVLSIVSSNTAKNIKSFLEAHNLELFDHLLCTSSLFGKHRTINQALRELGIASVEAVYIGDELRDITACKKVPIRIIAVSWGYDHLSLLQEGKPDFLAHTPSEITQILTEL